MCFREDVETVEKTVLDLLLEAGGGYRSGEEMSGILGISRAAVWKQIQRLRTRGYGIDAATNLGYCLTELPDQLDGARILSLLGAHPWADRVHVLETVDSTNSLAKREALLGAPDGSVWIADEQTGGRGRQGREFLSPKGKGLYLSVLLRPRCIPAQVAHSTAMAAVAACDAIESVTGLRPGIKWTNDLILGEKKCTGILSELSAEWESNTLESLVIGIGINCAQQEFPGELRDKATSLRMETGTKPDRDLLAAALTRNLYVLSRELLTRREDWLRRYRADCITIGRQIRVRRGDVERTGVATGLDENGGLLVRYDDTGETGPVYSGEVSIRGTHGYI